MCPSGLFTNDEGFLFFSVPLTRPVLPTVGPGIGDPICSTNGPGLPVEFYPVFTRRKVWGPGHLLSLTSRNLRPLCEG